MEIHFSPSLMCLDYLNLKEQIEIIDKSFDMMHIDIMDGHFAPNIVLSLDFLKAIRPITKSKLDVHLMVTNPEIYISQLAKIGVDYITVHSETILTNSFRVLNSIKEHGIKAGVAMCPATPIEAMKGYAELLDILLIMTVDIGYAGQKFIPQMLRKIEQANEIRINNNYNYLISVDGAIDESKFKKLQEIGTNVYVLGSSGLFLGDVDLNKACSNVKTNFFKETGIFI